MVTDGWYDFLKELRQKMKGSNHKKGIYKSLLEEKMCEDEKKEQQQFISKEERRQKRRLNNKLVKCAGEIAMEGEKELDDNAFFALAKKPFDEQCETLQNLENKGRDMLEHAFSFMEKAFENGQEMVVFVTELTIMPEIAVFLSEHPMERYEKYKNQLLIGTKRAELLSRIARD